MVGEAGCAARVEQYFGANHAETANALALLAKLKVEQGAFQDALEARHRCMAIHEALSGKDGLSVAREMKEIAEVTT